MSEAIERAHITVVDVIKAWLQRGFREAEKPAPIDAPAACPGDYLQTSAMIRDGQVISAVNDPNHYLGPGTGYRVTRERAASIVPSATC